MPPLDTVTTATEATVCFNGTDLPWISGLTVAALLEQHAMAPASVATAVNGRFVAREQRGATALQPGDQVLTFQAIVGG